MWLFMSSINCTRSGCKDVFRSFLVKNATYEGNLEIPAIKPEKQIPRKMISFSKAISSRDFDCWVHFYEDDVAFERIWNNPQKYLPILLRYEGVITPDFSLYRDMPLVMQQWNIYRSRAIGHWLQSNGASVIVNTRWGDERTFDTCCIGAPKFSPIAVGSHGCIKLLSDRSVFIHGLDYVISKLRPNAIIVYGSAPNTIFEKYRAMGITILQFDSDYKNAHKKAVIA